MASVGGEGFVVAGAAAVSGDPGQCSFDDPTSWQDNESGHVVAAFDDLHGDTEGVAGPVQEFAGVAAVGPDEPDPLACLAQVLQQRPGTVAVLNAGRGDQHTDQQPDGVNGDVAFPAVDLI